MGVYFYTHICQFYPDVYWYIRAIYGRNFAGKCQRGFALEKKVWQQSYATGEWVEGHTGIGGRGHYSRILARQHNFYFRLYQCRSVLLLSLFCYKEQRSVYPAFSIFSGIVRLFFPQQALS